MVLDVDVVVLLLVDVVVGMPLDVDVVELVLVDVLLVVDELVVVEVVVLLLVVVVVPAHPPTGGTLPGSAGSVPQSSSVRSRPPSRSRSMPIRVPEPGGTALNVISWPAVLVRASIDASDRLAAPARSGRKLPPPM